MIRKLKEAQQKWLYILSISYDKNEMINNQ